MIWFTSDTHFMHPRILHWCSDTRLGYTEDTADAADAQLIANWNQDVAPDDTVYHLGDVTLSSKAGRIHKLLDQLHGRIHLIAGNHDETILEHTSLVARFESVTPIKNVVIGGSNLVLCHFPIEHWKHRERGAIHLHGHLHGDSMFRGATLNLRNRMDVGIDTRRDMRLYSWPEIQQRLAKGSTGETD